MGKFLIGLVTGIVIVVLGIFLVFFALIHFVREKPPVVANNSVLVLRLEGSIPEKPPVDLATLLGAKSASPTVTGVWMDLRKAAADPHIKAVVLEPEDLSAGWAKLEEFRSDIEQFRKSNKPVYAYLRTPGAREYYVALAADKIYLGDSDRLFLKGLRAELMYFQKTLEKLGVNVEVEHAGKYKDFGDMFTRTNMSPETREVIGSIVDNLYGNLVNQVAAARKKSPDEVRALIDRGPFTAPQALQAGLVDELRFEDQLWGELKDRLHSGDLAKVSIEKYGKVPQDEANLPGKSHIAVVAAQGDIVRGDPSDDGSEEGSLTSYGFDKLLRQVGSDSTIKAVLVRIDSPGGEVTASDEIYREMGLLSKKKPVVISMSDVAASGGYYMALSGDPIVAYPQTETGSIGVVFGKPNLHGLYDKLGITKDAIQQGKHADVDSDYTPLSPDERELLRQGVDDSYKDFVTKVANARHRSYQEIDAVAQGRVWLGSQAQPRGLVDELGGLDAAIALLKKKANIPAGETVAVDLYPAQRSLLDLVMKRSQNDVLDAKLRHVLGNVPFHAWMRGGYLRIMPNWLEVR